MEAFGAWPRCLPRTNGALLSAKGGDLIGWLGWVHKRPIEHLRAAENCELLEIDLKPFENLGKAQPACANGVLKIAANRGATRLAAACTWQSCPQPSTR